jgi:hypothetical protein
MKSASPPRSWIDTGKLKANLQTFFKEKRPEFNAFGSTVNQVFEAFVFASVATWYRSRGWTITFVHPKGHSGEHLRLKYSTRGRPENYTYIRCVKGKEEVHLRHSLRVATKHFKAGQRFRANIVLDVAILSPVDTSQMSSDSHIENRDLISFGEAKHMSAFAELVANFVGLVHELQPKRLKRIRNKTYTPVGMKHPSPFLFVSGFLFHTAQGIAETIAERGLDIDIYWRTNQLCEDLQVKGKQGSGEDESAKTTTDFHAQIDPADIPF